MAGKTGNAWDRAGGRRRPHYVLPRFTGMFWGPVACALVAWLWVGVVPALGLTGAADLSVAARTDEPKSDHKKKDDDKAGEKKSDHKGKEAKKPDQDKQKDEDKPAGDKKTQEKKSEAGSRSDKGQAKKNAEKKKDDSEQGEQKGQDKAKDEDKKKEEDKEATGGALSEEDLAEMKRILMEKVKEREQRAASQPAPGEPEPAKPPAHKPTPATQPKPADQEEADAPSAEQEGKGAGKPQLAKPTGARRASRPGPRPPGRDASQVKGARPGKKPSVSKGDRVSDRPSPRGPDRDRRARGDQAGRRDQPSVIMPLELPEGKRAWDMPEDWRPFFFSFELEPVRTVLEDWSRMAGLSILNLDNAKGQVSYQSLEYMNYWEAFAILNELLADQNLQLIQDKQHLRLVSPPEIRQWISEEGTFTSRHEFEQARPHDYAAVKVFFVPPPNVAPRQVAQWINDLPDSVRLGSSAEGHMHVSGNTKDVRKLFRLVDIVNAQEPVEGRPWRWIPVENVDVNQVADLVRQFVDTRGTVPQPRGKRGAPAGEALEDYAEVDVIAVPKSQMLLVRAMPATLKRIESLVREIDGRYIPAEEVEPAIILLEHAKVEEIIPLLQSLLTGEPAAARPGKGAPRTSVRRKKGTPARADELDLSRTEQEIQLIPEPNTNSLIVIADQQGLERVRKLLKVFDVPGSAPIFERLVLRHAEVEAVQQVLSTLYGGGKRKGAAKTDELTIITDAASHSLFLAGMEDAVKRAREVVEQMDVETASPVTHLVTLVNQTPSALAQILNQMETGAGRRSKASVGPGGLKIIGDDASSTLIVVCPDNRWPELKDLIGRLDREVEEFQATRTFKILGGDARQVANLLTEMFGGRSSRRKGKGVQPEGVSISVDPLGRLIFVRGQEKTIEEMAAIIEEMESEVAGRETVRRTFQLVHTSASEIVKALTSFFPATSRAVGKRAIVPGAATFAPVGRSTVVVETTGDKMDEIAALIGELDAEDRDRRDIISIALKDADAQQVVRALESMFAARGGRRKGAPAAGPTFTTSGKKIIVVADPALFPRIQEAVAQFEGEGTATEFRRYAVKYADVVELARLLEGLLGTRAADIQGPAPPKGGKSRGAPGGVVVSADPRTKTLFVAAPGEVIAYADELLEALDAPQPEDVEEVIVRTVQLQRADVEEMISSLRQMLSGRSEAAPKRVGSKSKKTPGAVQTQMTAKMKGPVSMVPAPGANAVILRGIESDVDRVEELILAIDASAVSRKRIARRYDAVPTGLGTEELADTIIAVADSGKPSRKGAAEDELDLGPRVGKDLVITTDWYTDTLLVIATPEKQAEVEVLLEALSLSSEGTEGAPGGWPIHLVDIRQADPYDIRDAIEDYLDDIVERGPKTRVRVIEGANMLSLSGPEEQTRTILEIIDRLDQPGLEPPHKMTILSVSSPVPLQQVLALVQQQLPDVQLETQGGGQILPGYWAEEEPLIEEVKPTLGPNTLAYISAELQRLILATGDEESKSEEAPPGSEPRQQPEEDTGAAKEQPGGEEPAQAAPTPKVTISFDEKTGTFSLRGSPRYVEQVSAAIDEVLDELKKLPIKPDVRVFRIKYANVNEVAQIMESILGAQSGGAASRRQQQLAQQLRLQQQLLQQRQAQQRQAQLRRMAQQLGQREEKEPEKEEEPEEREEVAKEFGTSKIRIYPDPRTSTIVVRAATEDYPTIIELIARIDKPAPSLTDFRIFKLTKLKAADVEAAIKTILRLDRQPARTQRPRPGQRPGTPAAGGQMQMIAQLEQQMAQLEQVGAEGAVSINWAEQVTITSDTPTNTILASGPAQAIDYIESMIEQLEGQEIEKEIVKTICLVHTTVDEVLPVLTETFAPRGSKGGAGGRLRMPAGAGQQEAVQTAVSQVVITGDSRTNTLIVKAVDKDMVEVEALIARLDVDTGDEGRMQAYRLAYADAASVARSMNEIYVTGDKKSARVRIVADTSTNSVLISAPPDLREEILTQIQAMDILKGQETRPRTIAITAGNAETIAQKLQQVFVKRGLGGGEVSILGDNIAKQLVVVAPDAVFEQIKTLVGSMDKTPSEATIQIYELEHALAEEALANMQEMIKQMAMNKAVYGAGKDVDLDSFAATADARTNSIIVMGSPGTHALIGSTLARMDVPPKESVQVATMIFPLILTDANEVARQVQQLFAQRRKSGVEPPVATPNPGMNTLIVRGTQEQLDEVQKLINDLEGLQPPGQGELQNYTVRLLYAKAEDVSNTLNEYYRRKFETMLRGNVKGVKPTDMQVTITPDINSNQIFVVASESNRAEIDQLLSTMDVEGAGAQTTLQTQIFSLTFADPGQTASAINNAFLQRGRIAESERVQAVPEYGTRSLIVSANAENMAKIENLVTQLDADTGTGRRNFTYEVKEARVLDLVNVLRDFVNQSKSRTGREQLPIALVANEATNTMLISATQAEYDELRPTIELLDRPPEAETGRYAKAYKLEYSDPNSTYNIIQDAFQVRGRLTPEDLVTAAVDWGTSTLIVVANEENHGKVAALLEEMDQADVSGMQVRQIEVHNAGAQEVAQALQQMFIHGQGQRRAESSINIVNAPGTNLILVRSDEQTFEEIQRVVAQMDSPDALTQDVRVVMLENVDPQEAKTILEDYLRKPGGRGDQLVGDVRVTPADSLNAVVISGPTEQLEQAVAVVSEFDLDPTERGEAPQVIQIVHGDAVQMAETLARMFEPKGARGRGRAASEAPVIEAVAGSNSLIVKARKPDLNMILSMVASLDTEEMSLVATNIEIIRVAQGINVQDLALNIERVINDAERERVKKQKGAKPSEISIETDVRTNALMVAGTRSQVEHVRRLVAQLEEMKPVGPGKILIRKPLHRSAADIKAVLDELVEEKSGTTTRGRSSGSRQRRSPAGRGR